MIKIHHSRLLQQNPFGSVMQGRQFSAGGGYKYGFNGKEKDTDIADDNYDFGARIYDARIGRWMAVDILSCLYNSYSPYIFSLNSPILLKDINGKDLIVTTVSAKVEILKILVKAFGQKALADFSFEESSAEKFTLNFTGNIALYEGLEQHVLTSLLKIVNSDQLNVTVYFQTEFITSDINKIKSGGGNVTSTTETGGEALIAKDKPKNDYSESNLYIDPDAYAPYLSGTVTKNYFISKEGGITTNPGLARCVTCYSDQTYTEEQYINLPIYSRFFHGIGHVLGGRDNPAMAETLEFKAGLIHKKVIFSKEALGKITIDRKRNGDLKIKAKPLAQRERNFDTHPEKQAIKGRPLQTLSSIWDEN